MIHIIGTAHVTQTWSAAIRRNVSLDINCSTVERFESYLRQAAIAVRATLIAEELSKQVVDSMEGGASVAEKVATELHVTHLFCDPDQQERDKRGVKTVEDRETIWMSHLAAHDPNEGSIIFVCGATHCHTFRAMLKRSGIHAQVYCDDWTILSTRG